jgi:peptidoglycan/LPS O-acetylase OafA/YrhL
MSPETDRSAAVSGRAKSRADMKSDHELAGIEILRFVCAFAVLIWHYQNFFFVGEWTPAIGAAVRPTLPWYRYLRVFYDNGSLAVEFFWVISGFIFYWHYAGPIRTRAVKFADFLTRRFSRLYPLHFVTLITVAVAQHVYYRSHQTNFIYVWDKPIWFASHLLFASNWFTRQPLTFNAPIWSVSIEMLIYLSFFVIARAFRLHILVAVCAAAAFAICFNFLHSFINPDVFACGMYFFAGGVAQQLSARPGVFAIAGCVLVGIPIVLTLGHYGLNAPFLLFLATSSAIVFTRLGETACGVAFRHLAFLGNATYSSYLLHFPLQLLAVMVVDEIGWKRSVFYSPISLLTYLCLVAGLSLVVYRYFEMPAQNLIRGVVRRHRAV